MDPLDTPTICGALREFLATEVLAGGVELTDDAVLADLGVDSFSLMEVILFVERRFGVVLPMEALTPEHTRSVATLGRCVADVAARGA